MGLDEGKRPIRYRKPEFVFFGLLSSRDYKAFIDMIGIDIQMIIAISSS